MLILHPSPQIQITPCFTHFTKWVFIFTNWVLLSFVIELCWLFRLWIGWNGLLGWWVHWLWRDRMEQGQLVSTSWRRRWVHCYSFCRCGVGQGEVGIWKRGRRRRGDLGKGIFVERERRLKSSFAEEEDGEEKEGDEDESGDSVTLLLGWGIGSHCHFTPFGFDSEWSVEAASVFLLLNFLGKLTGTERERQWTSQWRKEFSFFLFFYCSIKHYFVLFSRAYLVMIIPTTIFFFLFMVVECKSLFAFQLAFCIHILYNIILSWALLPYMNTFKVGKVLWGAYIFIWDRRSLYGSVNLIPF